MRVLVSNIMMINERDRFDGELRGRGLLPVWPQVNQFMPEAQCLEHAGEVDGWLAGDDQISRAVMQAFLPRLQVISKWGTGLDSIDLGAARDLGIAVTNTPGAFRDAVSEYAIGLLLAASRRIAATDRNVRAGVWPKGRYIGLSGRTIGIVGYGAIGQGLGQRARGMGMEVIAYDPYLSATPDGTRLVDRVGLWAGADVIALCCNLTADNWHMLNASAFAAMRDEVMVVNVARGGLIDEAALIDALSSGKVSAAALDVFEIEPLPPGHALTKFDNVVLSSHNANSTRQAIEAVHANTLANLYKYLGV